MRLRFFFVLLSASVFAQTLLCQTQSTPCAVGTDILGLSDVDNAHAEEGAQSNYVSSNPATPNAVRVCCSVSGQTVTVEQPPACTSGSDNVFLALYSQTNSHGQFAVQVAGDGTYDWSQVAGASLQQCLVVGSQSVACVRSDSPCSGSQTCVVRMQDVAAGQSGHVGTCSGASAGYAYVCCSLGSVIPPSTLIRITDTELVQADGTASDLSQNPLIRLRPNGSNPPFNPISGLNVFLSNAGPACANGSIEFVFKNVGGQIVLPSSGNGVLYSFPQSISQTPPTVVSQPRNATILPSNDLSNNSLNLPNEVYSVDVRALCNSLLQDQKTYFFVVSDIESVSVPEINDFLIVLLALVFVFVLSAGKAENKKRF